MKAAVAKMFESDLTRTPMTPQQAPGVLAETGATHKTLTPAGTSGSRLVILDADTSDFVAIGHRNTES